MNIIRREIQQSVTEAIESAVKMFFSKEFDEIKSELATLQEIRKSMEFLSSQYDRVNSDIKYLQDRLTLVTIEKLMLSSQVLDMSDRLNLMEQHSPETNIEINGVKENKSDNLLSLAKQLCSTISVPFMDAEVLSGARASKMNDKNDRPRSIIIKLQSVKKRDEIFATVSSFNKKNTLDKLNYSHLGYAGNKSPVYVSEHLSSHNKKLHASTRNIAREKGYKYVWIRNGRIFVRKEDHTPAKQIKCYDSLNNL
ncbi:unnamed protein product [Parnassius mnemosyne]|uniref:FP protein C-terminal domain-containing protein n=1 Tax=Parnassius mnemosyne TaxID=213953 RepID=A0AAV1M4A2_9NEOP